VRQVFIIVAVLATAVTPSGNAAASPQSIDNRKSTIIDSRDAVTIPRLVSYQGRLTDSLGTPVPDTLYAVRFLLYAQASGGVPLWQEDQSVRTNGGLFSVLLGSATPIGSVPDAGNLYLGMSVGGGAELAPRLRIVSAAYAYKADTANYALSGGENDAWVRGRPDSVLYTIRPLGICRGGSDDMLFGTLCHTHTNFGTACTTGTPGQDYGYSTVGGGSGNSASGYYATVAGGGGNVASDGYATVAGGSGNAATGSRATVAGGRHNAATNTNATVAGGKYNTAGGYCAFVGGGVDNIAADGYATVAGGSGNHAGGWTATVAGGFSNMATGSYAAVPGGSENCARGFASMAAGSIARANHAGSFVWSDSAASEAESVHTTGADQFRVRARGGTWFFSDAGMTTGVCLAPGSNAWTPVGDNAAREDFRDVDRRELLERVAALRVRDYRMKDQDDGTRHIGPAAQDFRSAFGYGETGSGINLADADGVLLAAVQALYEQNRAQQAEIDQLKAGLAERR